MNVPTIPVPIEFCYLGGCGKPRLVREAGLAQFCIMAVSGLSLTPLSLVSSPFNNSNSNSKTQISTFQTNLSSNQLYTAYSPPLSTYKSNRLLHKASSASVESAEYIVEPNTNVKFGTSFILPGCSSPLSLLGVGYREKVFAIIGVKVYAVGLYANLSIIENLYAWKGRSEKEYQDDPSFFNTIYRAPLEKALQIILVRDIDGKTFWDALNDAMYPRIKEPSPDDEAALSTFRNIFQGHPLKKGTLIFLTWLDPSKMLVSISSDGSPSTVDATIESTSVNLALFEVFFRDAPVSPSLKAAVCHGLAKILK